MATVSTIFALILAAAQPATADGPAAPGARSAAVLDLFESVCLRNQDPPAGFAPVQWSAFPEALRLMNTYDHGGTFLRNETPSLTYVVRTRGEAHMGPGLETRCGVAAQGLETEAVVASLAARVDAEPTAPMQIENVSSIMLIADGRLYTVMAVEDGWVIVRGMDILIPAEMVRPGDLRHRRRGDRR